MGEHIFLPGSGEGEKRYRVVDVTYYYSTEEISQRLGLRWFYRTQSSGELPVDTTTREPILKLTIGNIQVDLTPD